VFRVGPRVLHPEKFSNLKELLGFSLPLYLSYAPSVSPGVLVLLHHKRRICSPSPVWTGGGASSRHVQHLLRRERDAQEETAGGLGTGM
jgi:hypothetical protein